MMSTYDFSLKSTISQLQHKAQSLARGKYHKHPYLFSRVNSDETYLISFPRSGNTWLRFLIATLINKKQPTKHITDTTVPDIHKIDKQSKPRTKPLIIKSHTPYVKIPAKVVYLVRDGRDALLSYFYLKLKQGKLKQGVSSPLDFYFDENIWPCPWHEHIAGWLNGLETWSDERYKIIYYENLVKSTEEQLFSIANFIGLSVTNQDVEQAILTYSQIKTQQIDKVENLPDSLVSASNKRSKWQDLLVGEYLEKYEALAGEQLQRLGYPLLSQR